MKTPKNVYLNEDTQKLIQRLEKRVGHELKLKFEDGDIPYVEIEKLPKGGYSFITTNYLNKLAENFLYDGYKEKQDSFIVYLDPAIMYTRPGIKSALDTWVDPRSKVDGWKVKVLDVYPDEYSGSTTAKVEIFDPDGNFQGEDIIYIHRQDVKIGETYDAYIDGLMAMPRIKGVENISYDEVPNMKHVTKDRYVKSSTESEILEYGYKGHQVQKDGTRWILDNDSGSTFWSLSDLKQYVDENFDDYDDWDDEEIESSCKLIKSSSQACIKQSYFIDPVFDELKDYLLKLQESGKIEFGSRYDVYDVVNAREKGEEFHIDNDSEPYDQCVYIQDSDGNVAIMIDYEVDTWDFAQEVLNKINDTADPNEGEPRFNVYVSSDSQDMTDGEPRFENITMDECEEYCNKVWKQFKAGKFNPWGYGALDPEEDDYSIDCACSNGVTEDEFGAVSWGKYAGKFIDYPKQMADGVFNSRQIKSAKKKAWKHPDEVAKDEGADMTCSKQIKSGRYDEVDPYAVEDLYLATINDGEIYHRFIMPTIENLRKHHRRGQYDRNKAMISWMRVADEGAKQYDRDFGSGRGSVTMFSPATRKEVAERMLDYYEEDVMAD